MSVRTISSIDRPVLAQSRRPNWQQSFDVEGDEACLVARVIVVSNVRLSRDALEHSLQKHDIEVLATCPLAGGPAAIRSLMPNAVVLDGIGPGAMAAAKMLRSVSPDLTIIAVLSVRDETDFLDWAELGVRGYADQNSSAVDLALIVQNAIRGEVHYSPRLAAFLASQLARLSAERHSSSELDELTPREQKVLELLGDGLSNKRIAQLLGISDTTTKNHVHNILAKLGLQSRSQAAVQYVRLKGTTIP